MTAPIAPTAIDTLSTPPTIADQANFDERADQHVLEVVEMVPQINASNAVTYNNALIAYNSAVSSDADAAAALVSKNAAAISEANALDSKNSASADAASALASKNAAEAAATQVDVAGALAGLPPRAGNGLKAVRVNAAGNALEYYVAPLPQRLHVLSAEASAKNALTAMLPMFDFFANINSAIQASRLMYAGSQFVCVDSASNSYVYTSPDAKNWTMRTVGSSQIYTIRNNGANLVATYNSNPMTGFKSTDGGVTWAATANAAAGMTPSLAAYTTGGVYIACNGANAYVTTNNGNTWSSLQTMPHTASLLFSVGNTIVSYSLSSTTYYTSTTGLTGSWVARTLPGGIVAGTGMWEDGSGGLIVAAYAGANYHRTTDGINWVDLGFTQNDMFYGGIDAAAFNPDFPIYINGNIITFKNYAAGKGGAGAYVKYAGKTWVPMLTDVGTLGNSSLGRLLTATNGAGITVVKENAINNKVHFIDTNSTRCMGYFV